MYINTPNIRGCNVIFLFFLGVETENNAECQWAVSVKGSPGHQLSSLGQDKVLLIFTEMSVLLQEQSCF